MSESMKDKIIMVTGASSGLGRAACVALGGQKANLIALGRDEDALEQTRAMVEEAGGRCLCVPFDLMEFDDYGKLFLSLKDQVPHLDGLIHCAASLDRCTPLQYVKSDDFRRMLDMHLTAPNMLTQIMLPLLKRADTATVIFTSCDMMTEDLPNWHGYGLAKRALSYAAAMWHIEQPDLPCRFVTLNPGKMRTTLFKRAYGGMHPKEVATTEAAAAALLRLLGADSEAVNGKSLQLEDTLLL
ncbi:MAG: SDR family NAD(P)-dependent oxidoreductase [Mariprofundaceae bacterium]|nr:SDR family NAD(P)-dependent oxidoreductase [Mariprofundaceae bacterium]